MNSPPETQTQSSQNNIEQLTPLISECNPPLGSETHLLLGYYHRVSCVWPHKRVLASPFRNWDPRRLTYSPMVISVWVCVDCSLSKEYFCCATRGMAPGCAAAEANAGSQTAKCQTCLAFSVSNQQQMSSHQRPAYRIITSDVRGRDMKLVKCASCL